MRLQPEIEQRVSELWETIYDHLAEAEYSRRLSNWPLARDYERRAEEELRNLRMLSWVLKRPPQLPSWREVERRAAKKSLAVQTRVVLAKVSATHEP